MAADFEALALPLQPSLYGAAVRMTRDRDAAEDLVQEAMLRAFRFWDTFQSGTNVKAWLFTILRNTFINGYHRRNRAADFGHDVAADMRSLGPSAALACSTSEPPGPEASVMACATQQRIADALASLPDDYRLAVTLADIEGLSYREIAEAMDCPIGTVMSRIYRGRKVLHGLLYAEAVDLGMRTDHARS